jgi:hypothetical protein
MDQIKLRQFETILAIISDFIETERLDIADLALTKFEELNQAFGNEFNPYLVQIKDKKALCLKYLRLTPEQLEGCRTLSTFFCMLRNIAGNRVWTVLQYI